MPPYDFPRTGPGFDERMLPFVVNEVLNTQVSQQVRENLTERREDTTCDMDHLQILMTFLG
jgi:hypothetical protein